VCKLTSVPETLPFECPSLRCPVDERILGYPQAEIPDRTAFVNSTASLTSVVQSPPARYRVNAGTSTPVTISARDASTGEVANCTFRVTVGPVEYLGGTFFILNPSNMKKKLQKPLDRNLFYGASGCVYTVVLDLGKKLVGRGARISTQLGNGTKLFRPLTVGAGRRTVSATLSPPVCFRDTQSLRVTLNTTGAVFPKAGRNRKYEVVVLLYGQSMY
jgi:hypothetical protein